MIAVIRILFILLFLIQISCGSKIKIEKSALSDPVLEVQKNKQVSNKKFVFIGDSLTAGYGVSEKLCFVGIIQKEFLKNKITVNVINAGVSGEMSIDTLNRIDWIVDEAVETIFLCIGGNDGLRGKSPENMRQNIEAMIKIIRNKKIKIIMSGMQMPPNYSKEYTASFKKVYQEIAEKYQLIFMPFLIEGVAGYPTLNLPDGIHPNEKGHEKIAQNIIKFLKEKKVYLK